MIIEKGNRIQKKKNVAKERKREGTQTQEIRNISAPVIDPALRYRSLSTKIPEYKRRRRGSPPFSFFFVCLFYLIYFCSIFFFCVFVSLFLSFSLFQKLYLFSGNRYALKVESSASFSCQLNSTQRREAGRRGVGGGGWDIISTVADVFCLSNFQLILVQLNKVFFQINKSERKQETEREREREEGGGGCGRLGGCE